MKKIIAVLLLSILLCTCEGQPSAQTTDEEKLSLFTADSIGVILQVPKDYLVIWRDSEEILELSKRSDPKVHMIIKRTEPFSMKYFTQEEELRTSLIHGGIKPDYMTAKKEIFKAKLEENRVYLSYFGFSGDIAVEGMEIINKQTGDLLSVIYEYPKESMTDKTVLEEMAESVHYFDANTPVSIFRNRLKALSPSVDSFLSLVTEMPEILKEVTPNQADRMIRDFIDFHEEYFKNMPSTEWKEDLKPWGVYPYQQGVLFNPMVVYGRFKAYLSPEFSRFVQEFIRETDSKSVDDVQDFSTSEEWFQYIKNYVVLADFVKKNPLKSVYMQQRVQETIKNAHEHFILGIKIPTEARVAYAEYIQNYPESVYMPLIKNIFNTIPSDAQDYEEQRWKLYGEWMSKNGQTGTFKDDGEE